MKRLVFFSLLIFILACKAKPVVTHHKAEGFPFISSNSLSEIIDLAKKENKLVYLDFYTSWCLPCKMMDEEVYTDKKVIDLFDEYFISYKVNAELANGPNLAFLYTVKEYPTLIFLDTRGRVIERREGATFQTDLIKLAREVLAKDRI